MQFYGAQVSWGTESLQDHEDACFHVVAGSEKVVISLNVAGSVRLVGGKEGLPFHTDSYFLLIIFSSSTYL